MLLVGKFEKTPDVKLFGYNVSPVTPSPKDANNLAKNIPAQNAPNKILLLLWQFCTDDAWGLLRELDLLYGATG